MLSQTGEFTIRTGRVTDTSSTVHYTELGDLLAGRISGYSDRNALDALNDIG